MVYSIHRQYGGHGQVIIRCSKSNKRTKKHYTSFSSYSFFLKHCSNVCNMNILPSFHLSNKMRERDKPIIKKLFFDFSTLSKHHNKTNIITKPGRESSIGGGINNSHLNTLNFLFFDNHTFWAEDSCDFYIIIKPWAMQHQAHHGHHWTEEQRYREIQTEARWVPFVLFFWDFGLLLGRVFF